MKGCAAAFPVIKESKWAVFCSEQHVANSNNAFKLWGIYWVQLWATLVYLNAILRCKVLVSISHCFLLLPADNLEANMVYYPTEKSEDRFTCIFLLTLFFEIREPVKFCSPPDLFPICCHEHVKLILWFNQIFLTWTTTTDVHNGCHVAIISSKTLLKALILD